MAVAVAPKEHEYEINVVHETRLAWGRASIKEGKYGLFLEFSKNVAKPGEPKKYASFVVGSKQVSDAYAMRDELDRFIEMCKQ